MQADDIAKLDRLVAMLDEMERDQPSLRTIPRRDRELLDLVQEECGEVVQARSKFRRGGEAPEARKPGCPDGPTNHQLLTAEIYDLMVLFELLLERGLISIEGLEAHRPIKLARLHKYTTIFEA